MIEFELDIPSLTDEGIQLKRYDEWIPYMNVRVLHSSSMIDWLIMIKMLTPLIDSFERRVIICEIREVLKCLLVINTMIVKHYKHYLDALDSN